MTYRKADLLAASWLAAAIGFVLGNLFALTVMTLVLARS